MIREDWSKRIQANQMISKASRDWCEGLVNEVVNDLESRTCENCDRNNSCEMQDVLLARVTSVYFLKDFGCNRWVAK